MTNDQFNDLLAKTTGHVSNARVTQIVTDLQNAFADVRFEVAAGLPDGPPRARVLANFGERLAEAASDLASNLRGAS